MVSDVNLHPYTAEEGSGGGSGSEGPPGAAAPPKLVLTVWDKDLTGKDFLGGSVVDVMEDVPMVRRRCKLDPDLKAPGFNF